MRRKRVASAAVALTLLLSAGCSGSDGDPDESPSGPAPSAEGPSDGATFDAVPARRVELEMGPGIDQPGKRPERSVDQVATAKVRPAAPGTTVRLQRRRGAGWKTVSRSEQDDRGTARFEVSSTSGAAYRALVVNPDGNPVRSEPANAGWRTIFRDEFDGSSLDTSKWGYRGVGLYDLDDDKRCATSDPSAVVVSEGTMALQVRRDPARADERCQTPEHGAFDYYLNGRVDTDGTFDFTYGVAAARVKFQRGAGQHAAFWVQRGGDVPTVPGNPGVSGVEVDVAEYFGADTRDGGLGTFVHYVGPQGDTVKLGRLLARATRNLPPGDAWWKRYHVFSVEWTPQRYVVRIDGQEVLQTSEAVSGVDEFLVLSLSTKDWELKKLDTSTLPSSMQVDWVRVWQQS